MLPVNGFWATGSDVLMYTGSRSVISDV